MTAVSTQDRQTSTFADRFGMVGASGYVRAITASMLGVWDDLPIGRRNPRDVAGLKADIRSGKKTPIAHLVRLAFAAVDAGVSVARVTAFLRELIEAVEHYAARRERRQGLGVLPFHQVFTRLNARGCLEQGEADAAVAEVDENDVASIDRAIQQLTDEREADEAKIERLRARKIELLAGSR